MDQHFNSTRKLNNNLQGEHNSIVYFLHDDSVKSIFGNSSSSKSRSVSRVAFETDSGSSLAGGGGDGVAGLIVFQSSGCMII